MLKYSWWEHFYRRTTKISGWREKAVHVNTQRSAILLDRLVRIGAALRFCGSAIRPLDPLWLPLIADHRLRPKRSIGKRILIQFRIIIPE